MRDRFQNILPEHLQPKSARRFPAQGRENNLSSPDQFRQRLLIETRRAERLNSPTSLIVIDLNKYLDDSNEREVAAQQYFDGLMKSICAAIRETDVACCSQESRILILLPDTDTAAARHVYERLTQQLAKPRYTYAGAEQLDLDAMEMEIISYTETLMYEGLPKNAVARRAKDYCQNPWEKLSVQCVAGVAEQAKGGHGGGLHLSLGAGHGATLAVPIFDVGWWDSRTVSDLVLSAEKILKRGLDVIGAITGLLLFSPLLVLAALLVRTTSRGPILYKQKRVGYRGEYFTFLKFRTMYDHCENRIHQEYVKRLIHGQSGEINNGSQAQPIYKIKNDPRITLVGRFLRKTSIDELPQLWNVLVGEMSLVGPRPPIPYEVEEYEKWHCRRFLEVKPGITGLWQVSGRNKTTFDEMVRLDIYYTKNWSLALDLRILLKTVKVMLIPDGF
ncbi:MAG: sugar transferase [bacterium]